jgi:glycosyltransferase involved in cell wall biosynthesis
VKHRVVILTEIIAPYRIPVFNALASHPDLDSHVIFLAQTDPGLRQWEVHHEEIRFSCQVLKSCRYRVGRLNLLLTRGMRSALEEHSPHVMISGGYNYLASWQAQRWARTHHVPFLLWSESNAMDARKNRWPVETAKKKFIHSCQGYVVPGTAAAAYLKTFGVPERQIFVAPNAVDVEFFRKSAEEARHDAALRHRLSLPSRYLLFVGRFVRAKGVLDLLSAYAALAAEIRQEVGLVLVGDGEEKDELVRRSCQIDPGRVIFPGFLQKVDLPPLYALAEALVLPTHSDTWGLVVNEALACGLPVIVSDVAGCVADLARDGDNGYVVRARDVDGLSHAMRNLLGDAGERERMAARSCEIGAGFTAQAWAQGIADAVNRSIGENIG